MPNFVVIRSLQSKSGLTIRTRKGSTAYSENAPQNTVSFGADNITAGTGANLLAAAGVGFCWVITSLVVSSDATAGYGVRVTFTGSLAALFQSVNGLAAPPPITVLPGNSPAAMPANSVFGYASTLIGTGPVHFSISGTAYKATVASVTNPLAQVIATPIDSNPAGDLG